MSNPYPPGKKHPIPARSGVAVPLSANQTIQVINTHGTQVIDFFAFVSTDPTNIEKLEWSHHLSMSHTRASTCHLSPLVGDVLTTTRREPILRLEEDTSGGVHDTLIAACDIYRYRELAGKSEEDEPEYYHDSCADNLIKGLIKDSGLESEDVPGDFATPQPLNLFMNIPVHPKKEGAEVKTDVSPSAGAELSFERPVSTAGSGVKLKALRGCVVVMSACPQDMLEINCREPKECHFVIED